MLDPGIIAVTERKSYPIVKHLQLNYYNKLDYGVRA